MVNRVFPYLKTAAPTVNDDTGDGYKVGDMWLDTTNDVIYQVIDVTAGAAVWKNLSGGGVESVVAGTNVTVDNTDPANPVVSASGGGTSDYIGQKRLSLESGVRVSTTDQTAKTTVYWTDGSTNLSVSVPATTSTPFDVFYSISGNSLSTVNWTNDTTRATALTVDATLLRLVKSGDADKLYLGTGRTTGTSGQCEDSKGDNAVGTASGTGKRFLWNYYNQKARPIESPYGGSHSYGTATWRQYNNDTNLKFEFVVGVQEHGVFVGGFSGNFPTGNHYVSLGLDSTTVADSALYLNTSLNNFGFGAMKNFAPGYHYVALIQNAYGGVSGSYAYADIKGWLLC